MRVQRPPTKRCVGADGKGMYHVACTCLFRRLSDLRPVQTCGCRVVLASLAVRFGAIFA